MHPHLATRPCRHSPLSPPKQLRTSAPVKHPVLELATLPQAHQAAAEALAVMEVAPAVAPTLAPTRLSSLPTAHQLLMDNPSSALPLLLLLHSLFYRVRPGFVAFKGLEALYQISREDCWIGEIYCFVIPFCLTELGLVGHSPCFEGVIPYILSCGQRGLMFGCLENSE